MTRRHSSFQAVAIPLRCAFRSLIGSAFAVGLVAAQAPEPTNAPPPQRVLIPFDFVSQFDDGRYGRIVGDLLWKKLHDQGGWILPESMLDVRDWEERHKSLPGPDTSLAEMRSLVRSDFGADVAIWGRVERAPGAAFDVYDFTLRVADFSGDEPKLIYETTVRTQTVSEIPHVYVKAALDKLNDRQPTPAAAPDPNAEARWRSAPNLVRGDFERGAATPTGWNPLPANVALVQTPADSRGANRAIRFQFNEDVAGTTGVLYYSDYFPVEEGAVYRFQCRWRSTGSAAKVFVKCYDELPSQFSQAADSSNKSASSAATERREVYRSQQNLKGPPMTWNTHTEDFSPRHAQFTPRWGRVMLYAYWPAGTVDWDDVAVKQIAPAPAP